MKARPTSSIRRSLAAWVPWLLPIALIGVWIFHVLRNYEVRAFSDPLNWLHFARFFETEIHTSKFALGFPIFLRVVLDIVGPFAVFLVNAPVLIATYLLGASLVIQALPPSYRIPRWMVVSLTLALYFCFDRWLVVQMVNPFRDPLSFLLVLAATGCLTRHAATGGARPVRAAAGGLLLGLACTVRETSVLLLVPFALYAFWSWRADSRIRFWRDAIIFVTAFAAGLSPLLLQSLASTGQAVLPYQAASGNQLVPGAHFTWKIMSRTVGRAWPYFLEKAGIGLLFVVGASALSIWKRNRIMAGLMLPAAVIHAVFYAFYWTFVSRYYYSVAIFAIPMLSWGLLWGLHHLATRLPSRVGPHLPRAVTVVLTLAAMTQLLVTGPAEPRFQIPQARQLQADLEDWVPADSLVFCRRNLCEIVRWFTHVRSFPVTALIPEDVPAEAALRTALIPYQAETSPIFLLEMHSGIGWETDAALLQRIWDLELVTTFPVNRYQLRERTGAQSLRLFRVRSWKSTAMPLPSEQEAHDGFARLDFSLKAVPDAMPLLSGVVELPTLARNVPRILQSVDVALPGTLDDDEQGFVEVRLRSPERKKSPMDLTLTLGPTTHHARLPQDRMWHCVALATKGPLASPVLGFQSSTPLDLHRIDWSIPMPTRQLTVEVGAEGDFAHLREGWYARETTTGGNARWTEPLATWTWRCATPGAPGRLTLRHFARNRPPLALPPSIRINDSPLTVVSQPDAEDGCEIWSVEIPSGLLQANNQFQMETEGWNPGGSDTRTLGLFVDWIHLETDPR